MSTLSDRQQEFTAYLVAGFPRLGLVGISPKGAAAFAGNGSVENNMNPVTHGPKDHGSDGVMQWRLERLDGPHGLKGWAESHGLKWDTLETQAAFTLWELEQPRYAQLAQDLRSGSKPLNDLTAAICWEFLRPAPASANLALRQRHARSVYKIFTEAKQLPKLPAPTSDMVSTVPGLIAWIISYCTYKGIDISQALVGEGWLSWAAIGAILIFLIDSRKPGTAKPEVNDMLNTLAQILSLFETVAPAMERMATVINGMQSNHQAMAEDVTSMKQDIASLKELLAQVSAPPADVAQRVQDLSQKISAIGGGQ